MPIRDQIITAASRIHTALSGGYTRAHVDAGTVVLDGSPSKPSRQFSVDDIAAIELQKTWLRYRLSIDTIDGEQYLIGSLPPNEAKQLDHIIREVSRRRQPEIPSLLNAAADNLSTLFDGTHYVRRSEADEFHTDFVSILRRCRGLVEDGLSAEVLTELHYLARFDSPQTFEAERSKQNRLFTSNQVPIVQEAVLSATSTRLTDEQAESIATDEDATLVLAGAGTGKTSAIVGKAIHLVANQRVPPEDILVLAFNRKAAEEIQERMPDDLAGNAISTFHAFGRRVIAESDVAPTISRLATDQYAYTQALDGFIVKMLRDLGCPTPSCST